MTTTATKTETIISNSCTGYSATIRTKGQPAIATIKKHLRRAKAKECTSITYILIDGVGYDFFDGKLLKNGLYADA